MTTTIPTPGPGRISQGARQAAGASYERGHQYTLDWYKHRDMALVEKHELPTIGAPTARRITGPTTVDYTGAINLPGFHMLGGRRACIPVGYDLKGVQAQPTYKHDPKAFHQLDFLLDAGRMGWLAFLLLVDARDERMWIVHEPEQLHTLRKAMGVPICVRHGERRRSEATGDPEEHFLPTITATTPDELRRGGAPGFDWLKLVWKAYKLPGSPPAGSAAGRA